MTEIPEQKPIKAGNSLVVIFLLVILAAFATVPLFIIIYRYVPDIIIPVNEGVHIDQYLTAILIFSFNFIIVRIFRNITIGLLIAILIILLTNEVRDEGRYGISDIIRDYQNLIYFIKKQPIQIPFLKDFKMTIRDATDIHKSIDYNDPDVRKFAIQHATRFLPNYRYYNITKETLWYFSIFSAIKEKWQYIPDPQGEEYYAKASESLKLFAGDCDDYSILMAACIKSIGGEVRLVRTPRHLYPEVKICPVSNFESVHYLIKELLFEDVSRNKKIYYHQDKGYIWLNFDYTAEYPGGKYISEVINGILNI